jgi:hypothetical protein
MLDVMRLAQEVDRRQLLLMDGTQQALNQVDKVALGLSGGVGGAWPGDSSNWRQMRGVWAPVAGAAVDNLLTNAQASAEDGSTPYSPTRHTLANIATDYWHGSKSLAATVTEAIGVSNAIRSTLNILGVAGANAPYTASSRLKAGNAGATGKTAHVSLYGSSVSTVNGNEVALSNEWKQSSALLTFTGDVARTFYVLGNTGNFAVGDIILVDGAMLEAGSILHMFALDYRNAVTLTAAKPAGLGVGASCVIVSFKSCLAGNAGLARHLFDFGTMECYIDASNNLTFLVTDSGAGTKQLAYAVNDSNMAADTEHTVVCQHDGAGNLEMYLNAAAVGTGSGAGTGIPDTPAATLYWGSKDDGANQLEAAMLGALYNGRLSGSEITRYSSGTWPRRYRSAA